MVEYKREKKKPASGSMALCFLVLPKLPATIQFLESLNLDLIGLFSRRDREVCFYFILIATGTLYCVLLSRLSFIQPIYVLII